MKIDSSEAPSALVARGWIAVLSAGLGDSPEPGGTTNHDEMGHTAAIGQQQQILEGHDIVCLGTVEWLVVRSVAEHTMTRLARHNRVLFVEPFRALPTVIREARWQRRAWTKRSGRRQVGPSLWVYTPPPLGVPGMSRWPWVARLNGRLEARLIGRVLRRLGFHAPILWTYRYNSAATIRRLRRAFVVYDCIDQDEALARSDRQRHLVRRLEGDLCRVADVVFGVTDGLVKARRPLNPQTFEVNCAADVEFFGKALDPSTVVPPDLASLPRPILGYMGGVDPWKIDISLLTYIASARPTWTIALVGYVWFGFDPNTFQRFPNIRLLGAKRYEDFPGYLKGMDVCLMPFPLNDITRNGDSLKAYEYLAAGKPVVSTPNPAAERLAPAIRIAATPAEFLAAIERSLEDDAGAVQARLALVKSHDWQLRVAQKSRLITERLLATAGTT